MRIVVALGGNVLLQRSESPEAEIQESHVNSAVGALTPLVHRRHSRRLGLSGRGVVRRR
jgi:carbamate kinase